MTDDQAKPNGEDKNDNKPKTCWWPTENWNQKHELYNIKAHIQELLGRKFRSNGCYAIFLARGMLLENVRADPARWREKIKADPEWQQHFKPDKPLMPVRPVDAELSAAAKKGWTPEAKARQSKAQKARHARERARITARWKELEELVKVKTVRDRWADPPEGNG